MTEAQKNQKMQPTAMLHLEIDWPEELAWAFAQFLKRAGYSDYRLLAIDDAQAYAMQEAADKLRAALAEQGCAPR